MQKCSIGLENLKNEMEEINPEISPEKVIETGSRLHNLIAETAHNTMLYKFYQELCTVAALTRNLSKYTSKIESISRDEHILIINSLIAGNREDAEGYMRLHLRRTCERIVSSYLQKRDDFPPIFCITRKLDHCCKPGPPQRTFSPCRDSWQKYPDEELPPFVHTFFKCKDPSPGSPSA